MCPLPMMCSAWPHAMEEPCATSAAPVFQGSGDIGQRELRQELLAPALYSCSGDASVSHDDQGTMGSTFMAVGLLSCVRADHAPLCTIEQSFLSGSGLLGQGLGFITVTVVCTPCQCHSALLVGHSGSSNIRFMSLISA